MDVEVNKGHKEGVKDTLFYHDKSSTARTKKSLTKRLFFMVRTTIQ